MSVHIEAKKGDIAETVLMPGDPLRAKFVAENYLENATCYNEVRGMLGFTGFYKGKRISIQGGGMGIPTTAIYINELVSDYGVKNIFRVGTCGALQADLKIGKVILALGASTDSNINKIQFNGLDFAPTPDFLLLKKAYEVAMEQNISVTVGNIFSSDVFYSDQPNRWDVWEAHGILGVEMETSILYSLAPKLKYRALSILTVSDNIKLGTFSSSKEREQAYMDMMKIALEVAPE